MVQKWSSTLCACCEDPALCCIIGMCQCNTAGQLYERVVGPPGSCLLIAGCLWILFIVTTLLSQTANALADTAVERECTWLGCRDVIDWDQLTVAAMLASVSGVLACATTAIGTYALCATRRRIRARDGIPADACGDVCVSYWCGVCSLVQMARHEGFSGTRYQPCTSNGTIV